MMEVVLYYSDDCKYCKDFEPTWKVLKESDKLKENIKFIEYNYKTDKKKFDEKENENNEIKGFPTIRIHKDGQEFEYIGERTPESIMNNILAILGGESKINTNILSPVSEAETETENVEDVKKSMERAPLAEMEMHNVGDNPSKMDGGSSNNYEEKYRKYKAKYINLKQWMNKNGY